MDSTKDEESKIEIKESEKVKKRMPIQNLMSAKNKERMDRMTGNCQDKDKSKQRLTRKLEIGEKFDTENDVSDYMNDVDDS
jgi:hypothetical protein